MTFFEKAADSGFSDQVGCTMCGGNLSVIRRTPHPELGYEVQTLGCDECAEMTNRSVENNRRNRAAPRFTGL
jgi:hypothetical protein